MSRPLEDPAIRRTNPTIPTRPTRSLHLRRAPPLPRRLPAARPRRPTNPATGRKIPRTSPPQETKRRPPTRRARGAEIRKARSRKEMLRNRRREHATNPPATTPSPRTTRMPEVRGTRADTTTTHRVPATPAPTSRPAPLANAPRRTTTATGRCRRERGTRSTYPKAVAHRARRYGRLNQKRGSALNRSSAAAPAAHPGARISTCFRIPSAPLGETAAGLPGRLAARVDRSGPWEGRGEETPRRSSSKALRDPVYPRGRLRKRRPTPNPRLPFRGRPSRFTGSRCSR